MEHFTITSLCAAVALALATGPALAVTDAERIKQLEEQLKKQQEVLDAMRAEIATLSASEEASEDMVEEAAGDSTADDASDLSVKVYGFAMADMIYDFKRVDPNWDDTLRVSTIPTQSGTYGNDGDFIFGVRQSRLGISGGYGDDITFLLEAELFGVGGDEGQTTPRLRHAWATWKNFGMGQYWSNFMDIDIFPNTIDYWGPTGMVFYRNQQARYTIPLDNGEFSVALEDPSTALTVGRFRDTDTCSLPNPPADCDSTDSTIGSLFQSHNDVPDISVRYRQNGDFGHFQVAGMVRKLGYERLDTGQDDEEYGWGVNTSASLRTIGRDVAKIQVVYGEGIGNYMNDGGIDIAPDSANLATTGVETVPLLGIVAYYDRYWNDQWSTSVGWSMIDLDTSNGQADSEFERGQIAQVNLLHYPADNVLLGTEFSWGEREDVDGNTGSDYRVQFSLKVNFDSGDLMAR